MRGPRISIRYKVLAVTWAVLIGALATHLHLATSLYTRDKLAYVYDLSSSAVEALAEQVRSSLVTLREQLVVYAEQAGQSGIDESERRALGERLFRRVPEVVRVEVHALPEGDEPQRLIEDVSAAALGPLGVTAADLRELRRRRPLPLAALGDRDLHLANSSLPPHGALLTLAVPYRTPRGERRVVVADVRQERLARLFGRSSVYTSYLVDDQGQVLAHPEAAVVVERTNLAGREIVAAALRSAADLTVSEFRDQRGAPVIGAFARVGAARCAVVAEVPRARALAPVRDLVRRSALLGGAVLAVALVISVFFARRLTTPIRRLHAATRAVAEGRALDAAALRGGARDEVGDLTRAFGEMARTLHETHEQLVHSEKMAAFGQLGAGFTHELRNPLGGVIGLIQVAREQADDPRRVRECLEMAERHSRRCHEIVEGFLRFARRDAAELALLDVNGMVAEIVRVALHQLQTHEIQVASELGASLPRVRGNAGQLQQVVLNLLLNAQQAMPEGGQVRVATRERDGGGVEIAVSDTGPGVPPELRRRIFEPFFTTKPPGQGTGLGLSVSVGIVEAHGGRILVEDTPGGGATFRIVLAAAEPAVRRSARQRSQPAPPGIAGEQEPSP